MTALIILFVWILWLAAGPVAASSLVYVCERGDGSLTVTNFSTDDPSHQAQTIQRLRDAGLVPGAGACWMMAASDLPPRSRPDAREAASRVSERHRWRRVGQGVIADPTVKQPQAAALRREYGRLFPPVRWAEIVVTPLGSSLDQAVRDGRWADVRAALGQTGTGQPLTAAEIAQFRAILRDYQAD